LSQSDYTHQNQDPPRKLISIQEHLSTSSPFSERLWDFIPNLHPTALCECGLREQMPEHILQTSPQHVKSAALLAGAHWPNDQALGDSGGRTGENYQLCRVPRSEGLIGHGRTQKKIPNIQTWVRYIFKLNSLWKSRISFSMKTKWPTSKFQSKKFDRSKCNHMTIWKSGNGPL
jgi:hypothetical protein